MVVSGGVRGIQVDDSDIFGGSGQDNAEIGTSGNSQPVGRDGEGRSGVTFEVPDVNGGGYDEARTRVPDNTSEDRYEEVAGVLDPSIATNVLPRDTILAVEEKGVTHMSLFYSSDVETQSTIQLVSQPSTQPAAHDSSSYLALESPVTQPFAGLSLQPDQDNTYPGLCSPSAQESSYNGYSSGHQDSTYPGIPSPAQENPFNGNLSELQDSAYLGSPSPAHESSFIGNFNGNSSGLQEDSTYLGTPSPAHESSFIGNFKGNSYGLQDNIDPDIQATSPGSRHVRFAEPLTQEQSAPDQDGVWETLKKKVKRTKTKKNKGGEKSVK